MNSGVSMVTMNLVKLLEDFTDVKGWHEVPGPSSGCGLDYWYETDEGEDDEGEPQVIEAYVNVDQGICTVSINDENIFEGDLAEAGYAKVS